MRKYTLEIKPDNKVNYYHITLNNVDSFPNLDIRGTGQTPIEAFEDLVQTISDEFRLLNVHQNTLSKLDLIKLNQLRFLVNGKQETTNV